MNKICIAPWLVDRVESVGEKAICIPNGFDAREFYIYEPIEKRNPFSVAFMEASAEWKGVEDTVKALSLVTEHYPQLTAISFGTGECPDYYPSWIIYKRLPSHDELLDIYNHAAIFVGASHFEGFGLTIGESMCCGCAVACTDNGGFSVMVQNKITGLLSPIKNPQALADNILAYLEHPEMRIQMAKQGYAAIVTFNWKTSVEKLVDFLHHPYEIN